MNRKLRMVISALALVPTLSAVAQTPIAQTCRFLAPDGPACVYGQALRRSPSPLRLDGALHLVRDLRPDNGMQPFVDIEMLKEQFDRQIGVRSSARAIYPAQTAFDAALSAAYEHEAGTFDRSAGAREALQQAKRLQEQYRAQANDPRMPPPAHDRAVMEVYTAIVDYLLGDRLAARTRMMAAASQFSPARAPGEVHVAGPTNLTGALRLWLESTWDVGPVAHYIGALQEAQDRRALLQEALAVLAMVPRFAAERDRLMAQARSEAGRGPMSLDYVQWAVRAADQCDEAMRSLDAVDLSIATFWSPVASLNDQPAASRVNAIMRPLHEAWREHFCKRTLPHRYVALSAAWKTAYDAIAALPAPANDLIDGAARGRAARFLTLYAADLRSSTRVGAALGLPVAPAFSSQETMPIAWIGFMGTGQAVIAWFDRPPRQAQVVSVNRSRLMALAALGAAYGSAFGTTLISPFRVSERVPGVQWQACPVPVTAVGSLYTAANVASVVGDRPTAACSLRAERLREGASALDVALASLHDARCRTLSVSTALDVSSARYRTANQEVLDQSGDLIEQSLIDGVVELRYALFRRALDQKGELFKSWAKAFDVAKPIADRIELVQSFYGLGQLSIAVMDRVEPKDLYERETAAASEAERNERQRRAAADAARLRLAELQDAFLEACLP